MTVCAAPPSAFRVIAFPRKEMGPKYTTHGHAWDILRPALGAHRRVRAARRGNGFLCFKPPLTQLLAPEALGAEEGGEGSRGYPPKAGPEPERPEPAG